MEKDIKKSLKGPGRLADRLSTLLFYASIILFLAAFNFRDNPGGWQLQYLPNLNGTQISDVVFLDSLNGIFVTNNSNVYDTSYIYKTTNGGNNWFMVYQNNKDFFKISFVNSQTGYVCGGYNSYGNNLLKTTNQGNNWISINAPAVLWLKDIATLNIDTIWVVSDDGLEGGVFRTTNGGQNWIQQFAQFSQNPDKIYMVNKNLGFIRDGDAPFGGYIGRTTNGGFNWTLNTNVDTTFSDMYFLDSLTGYKCDLNIQKTTDGGLTWQWQILPQLNYANIMYKLSFINKDTIFGVGGIYSYPSADRGLIYKTTNGGVNWGYQIPDTSFGIYNLWYVNFANKFKGWTFRPSNKNLYTDTGGDTTLYTSIRRNDKQIADDFILHQNYPNPFNQSTVIKYEIQKPGYVAVKIYDVTGKEIITLMNEKKTTGSYSVTFDAGGLSSGVYFYKFTFNSTESERSEIRKMLYIK